MAKDELYDDGKDFGERKKELEKNSLVRRPLPRIEKTVLKKNKGGRPRKMSPQKMKNAINRYFAWCEKNDEMPSIKGMMIHMGMYQDAFYRYIQNDSFTDLLEHARLIISDWAAQDVYRSSGISAGKVAYMKNVHAWSEKIENKNETTHKKEMSVGEARSMLEQLAPELLAMLGSNVVVQQLEHVQEAEIIEEEEEVNPMLVSRRVG